MPENTRKKQGESIKLPAELQEALRREIAPYLLRGEKAPTRGDLLMAAWETAHPASGNVPTANAVTESQTLPAEGFIRNEDPSISERTLASDVTVRLQCENKSELVNAEEWRWVQRVLRVVRSKLPQCLVPLDTNLDAFALMADLLSRSEVSSVSATVSPSPADIKGKMAALRAAQEALGRELAAAENIAKPPRKPGGGLRRAKGGNT